MILQFKNQQFQEKEFSFKPISRNNIRLLDLKLNEVDRHDYFSISSAYYLMTGRKGLWIYGNEETFLVAARHPNKKQESILLFPPIGKSPIRLIQSALSDKMLSKGEVQLARIENEDMHLVMKLQLHGFSPPEAEKILDWTYPVHIISTEQVIEHIGSAYRNFRSHINRAIRKGYTSKIIDIKSDKKDLLEIVHNWANDGKKPEFTYEDLVTPTIEVIRLMEDDILSLDGVIIYDKNTPIGFWIWEETGQEKNIAASLVRISIGGNSSAEFAGLKMCERLKEKGISKVCLGGSETKSLDDFKRKMVPIDSIELKTMILKKT